MGGARPPTFIISTITYTIVVNAPAERDDTHCTENPIYVFPEMKRCGHVPNSYIHDIHVSEGDLYISRIGLLVIKKIKFSSYIGKFRVEQVIAKSYMRKGFLIYEEMRKYFPIYEEAVSHI